MSKLFKNNITVLVLAFLSTFFFSFSVTSDKFSLISPSGSILLWSVVTVLLFIVYKKIIMEGIRSGIFFTILACLISIVFSAASVMGSFYYAKADFTTIFTSERFVLPRMFLIFLGGLVFFFLMVNAVASFTKLVNLKVSGKFQKVLEVLFGKRCILKSFVIMGICWVPHIIIHYPATLPVDSCISIMQYYGKRAYTTQHPIIHIQLLGHFSDLGVFLGDISLGLFILGMIQTVCLLLVFAYTIYTMGKLGVSGYFQLAALISFSIAPIFAGYATTLLGDIPYSIAMLLLTNELAWYLFKRDIYKKCWWHPVFTAIAVLGAFFRQNGFYVIVIILFFVTMREIYLLCRHEQTIRGAALILAVLFVPLCAGKINTVWLTDKYDCIHMTDRVKFVIPMQQIARYMVYHSDDLTDDELNSIQKVMTYEPEEYRELYNPKNYDGIKNGFNQEATKEDIRGFLRTWLKLFFRHPTTYVNATLEQTYSLFSPLTDNYMYYFGVVSSITQMKSPDYTEVCRIAGKGTALKNEIKNNYYNRFCDISILGLFVNQGVMDFLLLAACAWALCRKNGKLLLLALPLLLTLAVTFVGPAVRGHIRYTFPIFYAMPLFIGVYAAQLRCKNN